MKRFFLILLLLALAGLVLLPGPIGHFAQQTHDREFAALANRTGLSLDSYQRGWFATSAQHRVSLKRLLREQQWVPALPQEAALIVQSELPHGLVPASKAGGTLGSISSRLSLDLGGEPLPIPGQFTTRLSPAGDIAIAYHASADTYTTADGQLLSWQDTQLDIQLDQPLTRFSASGQVGRLQITRSGASNQAATVVMGPLNIEAAHQRRPSGLWEGRSEIGLTLDAGPAIRADNARVSWQVEAQPSGAAAAFTLSAQRIGYDGWEGHDARLRARMDRTNETALAAAASAIAARLWPPAGADERELELQLVEAIQQLLANGGDFRLKEMHLPTHYGIATGSGELRVNSTAGDPNPYALLANTRGEMQSRLPARLVTTKLARDPKFKDAFRYAVMLGVLAPEAGYYLTEAAYDGAQLYVNGRTLPLPF